MTYIVESNIECLLVRGDDIVKVITQYNSDQVDFKVFTITKSDLEDILKVYGDGSIDDDTLIQIYFDLSLD